jgi:hypothetical protein
MPLSLYVGCAETKTLFFPWSTGEDTLRCLGSSFNKTDQAGFSSIHRIDASIGDGHETSSWVK